MKSITDGATIGVLSLISAFTIATVYASSPALLSSYPPPQAPLQPAPAATLLLVRAKPRAVRKPEFLAVVDFNPRSPHYGKMISTFTLPVGEANPRIAAMTPQPITGSVHLAAGTGRMFLLLSAGKKLTMLDTSETMNIRPVYDLEFERGFRAESVWLAPGGGRLVIVGNDQKLRVADVSRQTLALDPAFELDLQRSPAGPARLTGLAIQ